MIRDYFKTFYDEILKTMKSIQVDNSFSSNHIKNKKKIAKWLMDSKLMLRKQIKNVPFIIKFGFTTDIST